MLEFPEVTTMAAQLQKTIVGKTVSHVLPPTKEHKFCWFNGDPADYDAGLRGRKALSAEGFGIYVEIGFDNGARLCFNDGVNVRLLRAEAASKAYQLLIVFTDGDALQFTVAMYGGILLHYGEYDNEYYLQSRQAVSPLSPEFSVRYWSALERAKPTLSVKAFLATEQRFPGIGNGVSQDILFCAGIHPKRKLQTLDRDDRARLLASAQSVLKEMADKGGRDTERDLFGNPGGYCTKMCKTAPEAGCPVCGGAVTKETYLGGSVYYCPQCQPLPRG